MEIYFIVYCIVSIVILGFLVLASRSEQWKISDYTLQYFLKDALTAVSWPIFILNVVLDEFAIGSQVILIRGEMPKDFKKLIEDMAKVKKQSSNLTAKTDEKENKL